MKYAVEIKRTNEVDNWRRYMVYDSMLRTRKHITAINNI